MLSLAWRTLKDFATGKPYSVALLDYGNGSFAAAHGVLSAAGVAIDPPSAATLSLIKADLAALLAQAPAGGAVSQAQMTAAIAEAGAGGGAPITLVDAFGGTVGTGASGDTDAFGNALS